MRTIVRIGTSGLLLLALTFAGGDAAQPGAAVPLTAYSQITEAGPGGDVVEVARAYLRANAGRHGLKPDLSDLKHTGTSSSLTGEHVQFQQTAGGYPVWGATVTVHVDKQRRTEPAVGNRYKQGVVPPRAAASVTREKAAEAAATQVGGTGRGSSPGDLVLFPAKDGGYRLAWDLQVSSGKPGGSWEVLVDAASGDVLASYSRVRKDAWGGEAR